MPSKFRLGGVIGLLAGVVWTAAAAVGADEPVWTPVGAARVDITPTFPIRLAGYGNRRAETSQVAQKLWAKALAIGGDDGEGPAVWIAFENCGLTPAMRRQVASRLEQQAQVRSDRLVLSATHSHTAPCLTDWAPYLFGEDLPPDHQAHVDRYTRELTEQLADVALAALRARRPARLYWGQGKVGFAVNRRVLKDGRWTGFGVQADGPVEHSLPILVAKNETGKVVACVANYACHCTTLGGNFNQVCGDWAGYAQEMIEADQPDCVAMVTIGCGADANPDPRSDDLTVCREHGRALADEVRRLVAGPLKPLAGPVRCRMTTISLPYAEPPSRAEFESRSQAKDAVGLHARKYLAKLDSGQPMPTSLEYPVASWSFGEDLALVFLAGEVVVDYAIRMKTEFDSDRLWITAYSNDVPCYIPSRRILAEGGYEADRSMVYYGRPQSFSPEIEELILDAVQKVLPQTFYSRAKQANFPPPRSPAEGLQSLQVPAGFRVELVAAEPLVEDPVAFDWTADGRLWVAEMRDYPNGMAWDRPGDPLGVAGGRIKLLTDTDDDGTYDRATVFLDAIPFPNGVKSWRGGVLVSAAPTIFYAEDTDGDGVADRREVLFEGFVEGNQQHRANGLRWGVDNWIYVANGDSGGRVRSHRTGEEVAISGRDLRIRPDTGAIETQSGQTQFGRCCDDWGNWFGGNNSNPLWHYVLEDQYLRRNPHYTPPAVRRDVPEIRGAAPVYPRSRTLARFNDFHTANRFTSACSPEIYRDEWLFGSSLNDDTLAVGTGHVFICEPVHNLVHHEVIERDGVSFRSRRPASEESSEFLASSDNWCRPVMVRTGPDGALWIADMYRQVIEHPEWIPQTAQRKLDLRGGSDRGRIYRVVAADRPNRQLPRLDTLSAVELVERLNSANGWQRDMAQQLLLWREARDAIPALEATVKSAARPTARLHALATLDGLGALRLPVLVSGLQDAHAGVRRHAVRLAEGAWNGGSARGGLASSTDTLVEQLLPLAEDPDPQVRQQVASSLGSVTPDASAGADSSSTHRLGQALALIAARDAEDPYVTAAVLSSLNALNLAAFADAIISASTVKTGLLRAVMAVASNSGERVLANRLFRACLQRLDAQSANQTRWDELASVVESFQRNRGQVGQLDEATRRELAVLRDRARQTAADESQSSADRIAALRFLGVDRGSGAEDAEFLQAFMTPQHAPELQQAAAAALASRSAGQAAPMLLDGWRSHSPPLRAQILDLLLSSTRSTGALLDSLESGQVALADLDARRRQQLARLPDAAQRQRAERLLGNATSSSRAQVVDQYQHVAQLPAEAGRGKVVFQKKCATCHRLEDAGQHVGPDLTTLTDKSPASLLTAVLDPNRAVESKFLDYIAITADGRQFTGMIQDETSSGVTLVGQEGKQVVLRRNELEVFASTGKSLMPEGLEKDIPEQELADVIAYVRSTSQPPKQFPGNRPELAHVRDDGSIRPLAMNARIFGTTLVFEDRYRNLGEWRSADDHAVWTLQVPQRGNYRVSVEYACAPPAAGNRFLLTVGSQTLGGTVESTGSWDEYRSQSVGRVALEAGPMELTVRSDGAVRVALFDLRQIVLRPE